MGAVTAAAGRQARLIIAWQRCRQRAEAKKQNQEKGKTAPHLELMLQHLQIIVK
jgi:hypothetical protein